MGHSQEEKAKSRQRILDTAASMIRTRGLNGFTIADVMEGAGLTHGSFYAHFTSRDNLVAQALQHALYESDVVYAEDAQMDMISIVTGYLSKKHRDELQFACAVSALASEVTRAGPEVQDVMHNHLLKYIKSVTQLMEEDNQVSLVAPVLSMMIGAVTLSRLIKDNGESDRILQDTSDYIHKVLAGQSK